MNMIVTRKTMMSREGAAPSGAAGGATHILLRIGEFASPPPKLRRARAFADLS